MKMDLRAAAVSIRITCMAEAISRSHGISWNDASFLIDLAGVEDHRGHDIRDLDVDGREWILWLAHRGLVELEDSMGILYFRISPKGRRVVLDARHELDA